MTARVHGASMVASVLAGTGAMLPVGLPSRLDGWVDGRAAQAWEADVNDGIAWADLATAAWAVGEYLAFGDGRPGVLVGADGWLYTTEEFDATDDEPAAIEERADFVARVRAVLAERGVQLVVAVVPAKARVVPEHLGRHALPEAVEPRLDRFHAALARRGVLAPRLPLQGESTFLRTDTHWTPEGTRVAAEAIAGALRGMDLPRATFETRFVREEVHPGDLLRYLPLGPFAWLGPQSQPVKRTEVVRLDSGGLFDAPEIPVALVGTSYSAMWDFDGDLKLALGVDVLNAAQEGHGPIQPMLDYLVNPAFQASPPRVVVWEIPERFAPVRYDLDAHPAMAVLP